jgi:retron-type reverse transcriptase
MPTRFCARKATLRWLKAGVLEDGIVHRSLRGTPQGGVVSPILSKLYLHHVVDAHSAQN